MNEREKRDLAWKLADGSRVFDFEKALEFVDYSPAEAEELIRNREERKRTSEEFARSRERRRQAFIEDFGYAPPRAS
ncbi:MAG TPA: hypothetical protein VKA35_08190 [Solirubrobacterales bacterium]|nr:hypothetical protein [Solirubrobacterales bacterium]